MLEAVAKSVKEDGSLARSVEREFHYLVALEDYIIEALRRVQTCKPDADITYAAGVLQDAVSAIESARERRNGS